MSENENQDGSEEEIQQENEDSGWMGEDFDIPSRDEQGAESYEIPSRSGPGRGGRRPGAGRPRLYCNIPKPPPDPERPKKEKGGVQEGAGRPLKEFDERTFENLCWIQCTVKEMERVLNADRATLDGWCWRTYGKSYEDCREEYGQGGLSSLRRFQFNQAEKNPTMAIFLGKNYLGQKDQMVQKIETKQEIVQKKILDLPDNGRRRGKS